MAYPVYVTSGGGGFKALNKLLDPSMTLKELTSGVDKNLKPFNPPVNLKDMN